jgi:osmotically-inducible protein OsmY
MTSDSEPRRDVEGELEWEPGVDERRIGVSVIDGVVTFTGQASSYAERWRAERAVERVTGVRGIATDLEVSRTREQSDRDIARAETARSHAGIERHEAEKAAWAAPGVTAVHNDITVAEPAHAA